MPDRKRDDNDRLLGSIAAGSAVLFAFTVAFVVVAQTVGPIFGISPGTPSDTILGTMVAAVVTLTSAVALRRALRNNNDDTDDAG